MPYSILGLPEEIQLNVLLSLPSHFDILRCTQTCRHLRALIVSSGAIQYRIHLGKHGMVEGTGASSMQESSTARSELLFHTIERRRKFQPTLIRELGVAESGHERAFDLLDGIYARLMHVDLEPSASESDGGAIAYLSIQDISGDCCKPAQATRLDIFPTDIAIAPSLDLIVFMVSETAALSTSHSLDLHLRTLSSGGIQEHPEAPSAIFRIPKRVRQRIIWAPDFHLSIDRDILALYVDEHQLDIFRWTSGRHIISWGYQIEPRITLLGFSLISPTCFVVGHSGELMIGALAVYRLPSNDGLGDAQIQMVDSHVTLSLPRFHPDQHTIVTGIFTSPPRTPSGVFEEASRITVVQVTVEKDDAEDDLIGGELTNTTYVARQNFFAGVWDRYMGNANQGEVVKVDWDDWGPPNMRLLDIFFDQFPDNSACSGSRLIYRRYLDDLESVLNDADDEYPTYYYLDFGDVHDMDFLEAAREGDAPTGEQALRVMAQSGDQVVHNIRTSLPYYALETRQGSFNWSTVLIEGDRLICSRPMDGDDRDIESGGRSIEYVYQL